MTIIDIHCTYLLYMWMYVFLSPTLSCVVYFLLLYTCFLLLACNLSISVSHKDALMSFVLKYFRIFGSTCFILKDRENVGKFDSWSNEGIFLGYSSTSKAYRVYNKRTMKVMETVVRTYVIHLLGTYVTIICNWLIL